MARLSFSNLKRYRKSPSFWALADQAVLSLGTFVSNIVVMRAYKNDLEQFGTYLLLLSIVALLNNLHASVITYPLSVKGAAAKEDGLRGLAASSFGLTLGLGAPMIAVVFVAAALLHSVFLAPFVAISLVAWQCQETTRRALMAHLRNSEAVWGDAVSYLGQAALIVAVCWHGMVPLWEIFTINALTSFAAAGLQAWQLRMPRIRFDHLLEMAREGWRIGRWLLVTNGLYLLTIQAITWTIDWYHGRAAVATFGALSNVIGVSHPVMFGICGLIVPAVAKIRAEKDDRAALRYATKLGLIGLSLLLPYYLFLLCFSGTALLLFCGHNSPYLALTHELRWYVAQYVFVYLAFITAAILNGLQATRWNFLGQLANAIVTAIVRIPATAKIGVGVAAAIWSGVFTYAAQLAVNVYGIKKATAEDAADSALALRLRTAGEPPRFPAILKPLAAQNGSTDPAAREDSSFGSTRRRILVSAYTLSPNRGSEPAGAWNIVCRLAKYHDLTVLTSPNVEGTDYRTETLRHLSKNTIPGLTIHYVTPPWLAQKLMKPTGSLARLLYYTGYASWQRAAFKVAKQLHENRPFDLVHQLNMTGYREPGYLWQLPAPFIWGPIAGACNMPWSFLSTMDWKERVFYSIRNVANQIQRVASLRCRLAAKKAKLIWYVGEDEKRLIEQTWQNPNTEAMLDSGTLPMPRELPEQNNDRPLRIVWSGVHIGRKGLPILLHALSHIKNKKIEVAVLGDGPQTERWDTLAANLGVTRMITWKGRLPRVDALQEMAAADVLAFTSLMEAASHVTLEAIAMGLPVICHDICGMSIAVDRTCGIKVPLIDVQTSINAFAMTIAKLVDDREELRRLTEGAARRATELTWDTKVDQICRGYERVLAMPESAPPPQDLMPVPEVELGNASVPST